MNAQRWADRLNQKDGTLWSPDAARAGEIAAWMGWLDIAAEIAEPEVTTRLKALDEDVQLAGFQHAVLAGMGGSSLCPDVLRHTFGRIQDHPELLVLDSTDPSTIAAVEAQVDLDRTVFLIASKSGGTLETLSHMRYFFAKVKDRRGEEAGDQFIAITDDGSGLHRAATELGFRDIFLNRADIGGRYSALSFFGMVPAAVMGLDFASLLAGAQEVRQACREGDAHNNPGLELGAVLGTAATSGRDKCTIICAPPVATLGMWLEQLLAESTGKEGRGIIPVEGEPLALPSAYGDDRLFAYLRTASGAERLDPQVEALQAAGQPVYTIDIDGPGAIGGEFLRWEVATAVAGAVIGINPFDQPNVQESKDNTRAVLDGFMQSGDFGVAVADDPWAEVEALLGKCTAGDYFALLAYTESGGEIDQLLGSIRAAVRDRSRVATTSGYGPRYLHSTGQLHKGGPNTGVFLILADERGEDLPIPGAPYGFKTLIHAQWAGDLKSLRDHGRRATMLEMGSDREAALRRLLEIAQRVPADR
jgi:glucose-6-phosphate isomerase